MDKLKKKSEEYSSGLGLIIINMTKINKNTGNNYITIPGFVYIYLSKQSISRSHTQNFEVSNIINNNEINFSREESGKKKKKKKKKKSNNNYQKNKIKNWDNQSNTSSNSELTPNKHSISLPKVNEQKMKFYEDETFGFTVYDHEEEEDSDKNDDDLDDYLSPDD